MPGAGRAEIYFIAGMMVLILIVCVAAVYIFIRTYKKEMSERAKGEQEQAAPHVEAVEEEQNVAS